MIVYRLARFVILIAVVSSAARCGEATSSALVAKAAKRIPWAQAFQEKSPHFLIITNTSKELAKQMSTALEQQYKDFVYRFQIIKEPKDVLPVKVFAERAEFKKYCVDGGDRGMSEHAAGFFDPAKKEIVLFWSDDPEDVLSTLYHEVTHYFTSLYANRHNLPTWMDEGLAVYFETAEFKNGRLETGQIPYGRLLDLQEAIKENRNHKLSQLVKFDSYGENGYNLLAYAEGWSLVYFFATSAGGKNAKLFLAYMEELKKGRNPEQAFQRAFTVSPDQIEPAWKKFVMEIGMKSARGHFERALAKFYKREYDEALKYCDEAIKIDPRHNKALHLRGMLLYWLKRPGDAFDALTAATTADPKEPRSFYYLARTCELLNMSGDKRGNEQAQEAAYLKAIELRPDYADALGLLAWLYAIAQDPKVKKIKDAVTIAERAVELDGTPEVLDTLSECYFQDGQRDKAIATIQKAIAMNPADKEYFKSQLDKFKQK
jgi:tetratricopeptide (TPR) repeat protein